MQTKTVQLSGNHASLWLGATVGARYPSLEGEIKTDVAIVGGGLAGLCTAMLLADAGIRSVVLEARCIASGVSGHTSAKISAQHGLVYTHLVTAFGFEKARLYAQANSTAIETFADVIQKRGIDCDFERHSAFTFVTNENEIPLVSEEVEVSQKLGLPASYVETLPLPFPVKAAVEFSNQAQFHPLKFATSLTENLTAQGCRIYENTRVLDIEEG
jgi:glycine/D-amino acid oxidase-like deaminating enzyme